MCTPFEKPGQFYFNQKINCMRAEGTVTYGYHNRTYTFDPADSFAVLDDGPVLNVKDLPGFAEKVINKW